MFTVRLACVAFFMIGFSALVAADEGHKLVGTWKFKSATRDGKVLESPEAITIYKHITPTHFTSITFDKEGRVVRTHGGSYSVDGEKYIEKVEYTSNDATRNLIGKDSPFVWKVEGKQFLQKGATAAGIPIDEVWERVDK